MKLIGVLSIPLLIAIVAFASDFNSDNQDAAFSMKTEQERSGMSKGKLKVKIKKQKMRTRRICKRVKLSDDQKTKLKAAHKQFMQTTKPLREKVQEAKKNYHHTVFDEKSTINDAQDANAALTIALNNLQPQMVNFKHDVLFNLVTFEQRRPMARCMKAKKRLIRLQRLLKHKENHPKK